MGGNDETIVALSRDTNSGTHVFFKENVVQMRGLASEDKTLEYGPKVLFLPSTEEGVSEVAGNPRAIFYPGLGYVTDEVKPLAVKKTADDVGVLPSVATALDDTYPVARPLLFYTDGAPEGTDDGYASASAGVLTVLPEGEFRPTLDGDVSEWPNDWWLAENPAPSSWGDGNTLRRLGVGIDDGVHPLANQSAGDRIRIALHLDRTTAANLDTLLKLDMVELLWWQIAQ